MRKKVMGFIMAAAILVVAQLVQAEIFYSEYGRISGEVIADKARVKVEGVYPTNVPGDCQRWVEQYRVEPGSQQLEFVRRILLTADGCAVFNPYEGDRFQVGYGENKYLFISPEWAVQKYRKVLLVGVTVSRDRMCPDCGLALQLTECARIGGPTVKSEKWLEAPPVKYPPASTPAPIEKAYPAAPAKESAKPVTPAKKAKGGKASKPEECSNCQIKVIVTDIQDSVGTPSDEDEPGMKTLQQKARDSNKRVRDMQATMGKFKRPDATVAKILEDIHRDVKDLKGAAKIPLSSPNQCAACHK